MSTTFDDPTVPACDDATITQASSTLTLLKNLCFLLFCIALAFASYLCIAELAIQANFLPPDISRITCKKDLFSKLESSDQANVLVFGNSVVIEGLDCNIAQKHLGPDLRVFNIAESAAGIRRLALQVEPCIDARAELLVGVLRIQHFLEGGWNDIPDDLCLAYSLSDYVDQNQSYPRWLCEYANSDTLRRFPSGYYTQRFEARRYIKTLIDGSVVNKRSEQRWDGYPRNYCDPWRYRRQCTEDQITSQIGRACLAAADDRWVKGSRPLQDLIQVKNRIQRSRLRLLIVVVGEHPGMHHLYSPKLLDQLDRYLESLNKARNVDATRLPLNCLSASDYIDFQHPNAEGRTKFSRALASTINHCLNKDRSLQD